MLLNIIMIIGGIALVLWGADRLTDGAVAIAARLGVPQIVIGLTVVAMGTSMPEFCVSLVSAINGTTAMAVGNVVGSNIFNSMMIVGIAAMITPITILSTTVKKDIPFALMASALLVVLCIDGEVARVDALILIALFAVFMYITLKGVTTKAKDEDDTDKQPTADTPVWKAIAFVIIGLACLVGGSNIFVNGATFVASTFGISDAVIGLTIVAMGTSLPELATTVVSARKGNSGIAIGNVLGSNVFNILMVLGLTGAICPMSIHGITNIDMLMLVVSMVLLWLFSFTKLTIQRWEGTALTIIFFAYLVWLIASL